MSDFRTLGGAKGARSIYVVVPEDTGPLLLFDSASDSKHAADSITAPAKNVSSKSSRQSRGPVSLQQSRARAASGTEAPAGSSNGRRGPIPARPDLSPTRPQQRSEVAGSPSTSTLDRKAPASSEPKETFGEGSRRPDRAGSNERGLPEQGSVGDGAEQESHQDSHDQRAELRLALSTTDSPFEQADDSEPTERAAEALLGPISAANKTPETATVSGPTGCAKPVSSRPFKTAKEAFERTTVSGPTSFAKPVSSRPFKKVLRTPGWILSLGAHLALLMLLALLTSSTGGAGNVLFIESALVDSDEEALSEIELVSDEPPLEPLESQMPKMPEMPEAAPPAPSDVGTPMLAAEASPAAPAESALSGDSIREAVKASLAGASGMGSREGAEFFGLRASGQKFVFLVDSSGSMTDGRFERAKYELLEALGRLEKRQRFYVMFYDQTLERMRLDERVEEAPVPATTENIERCRQWIARVGTERGRHPLEAMQIALEMLPDGIFLLSDGVFPDWVLEKLGDENVIEEPAFGRRPSVPIHCIAFLTVTSSGSQTQEQQMAAARMQKLASENAGSFRLVQMPAARRTRRK